MATSAGQLGMTGMTGRAPVPGSYLLTGVSLVLLAVACVVVYGAVVVATVPIIGVDDLLREGPAPAVAIIATCAVVLTVRPAHRLTRRLATRLLGERSMPPYAVLADFGRRIAAVPEAAQSLQETVAIVGTATGAQRVDLWVRAHDGWTVAASWSPDDAAALPAPASPDAATAWVPLNRRDELIGALSIESPGWTRPPVTTLQLLHDLGSAAAPVLDTTRLAAALTAEADALSAQNAELAGARSRVLSVADDERLRLGRRLAEGPLRELAAIHAILAVDALATGENAVPSLAADLPALRQQSDRAIESLRDLARGVYPPILRDSGVVRALLARYRRAPATVHVDHDPGRLPLETELTLYLVGVDAIDTALRHHAGSVRIGIIGDRAVRLTVSDDGEATANRRAELRLAADHAVASGGRLHLEGTELTVELPRHEDQS